MGHMDMDMGMDMDMDMDMDMNMGMGMDMDNGHGHGHGHGHGQHGHGQHMSKARLASSHALPSAALPEARPHGKAIGEGRRRGGGAEPLEPRHAGLAGSREPGQVSCRRLSLAARHARGTQRHHAEVGYRRRAGWRLRRGV